MADTLSLFTVSDYSENFHYTTEGYEALTKDGVYFRTAEAAAEAVTSFMKQTLDGGWTSNQINAGHELRRLEHADFEQYPLIQEMLFDASRPLRQQFRGPRAWMHIEIRQRSVTTEQGDVESRDGPSTMIMGEARFDFRVISKGEDKEVTKVIDGVTMKGVIPGKPMESEWAPLVQRPYKPSGFGFGEAAPSVQDVVRVFRMDIHEETLTIHG